MKIAAKPSGPEMGLGLCDGLWPEGLLGAVSSRPGSWSLLSRLVLVLVVGVIGFFGWTQGAKAACSNAPIRAAQSATFLPDCRAFELVSPPEGEPYLIGSTHFTFGVRASSGGGAISWFSFYPLSSSLGGGFHNVSTRGQDGWSTEPMGPRLTPTNDGATNCEPLMVFSADLSKYVLMDGGHSAGSEQTVEGDCPGNDPGLVAGEPEGFQNLLVSDIAAGAYALTNITPQGVMPSNAWFQDASDDFSHVVFEDEAKLIETAPAGASLYEWVAGAVSLVTVLPNGTPTVGSSPGAVVSVFGAHTTGTDLITHPVSADGTRAIFDAEGKLYLRENVEQKLESVRGSQGECLESAKACTVQLDASLGGGGSFLAADTTDSRIFFTDGTGASQHLYEYDTQTNVLSDLTPAGELGLAGLSGISDDGSYLYLVAGAVLATGATAGQPNLYVFHEGTPEFVATLGEGKADSLDFKPDELTARVSPNGRYFGFNSAQNLNGENPFQSTQIFLFDAVQKALHCVSCNPGGGPPAGAAEIAQAETSNQVVGTAYFQRNVLNDGRVFFDMTNPLVEGAGNGVSNVYEYEGGQLSLVSSGTSSSDSFFYDSSPNGGDVFFVTTQHLVRSDTGNGMRLYDARVDGGFSEPEAPAPCGGEGCRAAGAGVSALPPLLTTGLQGSGNVPPAKPKVVVLTRRQKLERALRACERTKKKRKRAACKRQARHRYGARSSGAKRGGGR
jgi:hypothetical protein